MKKLIRPRKIVAMAVAAVFALSALCGGAFVSLIGSVNAAGTGAHNKVTANYNITSLPRQTVVKSITYFDHGIPEIVHSGTIVPGQEGYIALFRVSSSRDVKIDPASTYVGGTAPAGYSWEDVTALNNSGAYEQLGPYEWRFYNNESDANLYPDSPIYTHEVRAIQQSYSFDVPTSAHHEGDTEVSFIPNVSVSLMPVTLPKPNSFIDTNGNDLFSEPEQLKNVVSLRLEVLEGMAGIADKAATAKNTALFKEAIYKNTEIRFYGTDGLGTDIKGKLYSKYTDGSRKVSNEADRTFVPKVPGEQYYAEYKFVHDKIKATFATSKITVVNYDKNAILGQDENGDADETVALQKQIRYDFPPSFSGSTLSSSSLTYMQEFQLPLPTVGLVSGSSSDPESENYQPVSSFPVSSVTSYTYITVEYWNLAGEEKDYYASEIITEAKGYKFTPKHAGTYAFLYHTTTLFGTGYTDHFETDVTDEDPILKSGRYVKYYPHVLFQITTNTVRPEVKWSVPFKYVVDENVEPTAKEIKKSVAEAAYGKTYQVGDAIVVPTDASIDYTTLFGPQAAAGTIIERHGQGYKTQYYDEAPDLSEYMPNNNNSAEMQVSIVDSFVMPALLGFNNVDSGKNLKYTVRLTRWSNGNQQGNAITFNSGSTTSAGDTPSTFNYDHTKPLVLNFADASNTDTTNGYGNTGYLSSWRSHNSKLGEYRIEVYATDSGITENSSGSTSNYLYYSFKVVSETDYKLKDSKPEFPISGLSMMQTYYEDDKISFNKIGVSDTYTNNVQTKYYLFWGNSDTFDEDEYIELDDTYLKNDLTYVVPLSSTPKDGVGYKILEKLKTSGGVLDIQVVAVAKTYYALSTGAHGQQDGKPLYFNSNGSDFGVEELFDYLQAPDEYVAHDMDGVAVESFAIKLYDQTRYGSQATIGLVDKDGLVGAAGDDLKDVEDIADYWKKLFGESISNAEQYQKDGIQLPEITVGYEHDDTLCEDEGVKPCNSDEFLTTVEFQVILPVRKELTGVEGGTTQVMSIKRDTDADNNRKTVSGLSFYPEEIGIHTFVARVYNGGGFVTVFTAQINVVGTPTTVPMLKGGSETAKVGEKCILPWAEVSIDGKPFITSDNKIYANYTPDEVMIDPVTGLPTADPVPYVSTSSYHKELLRVGEYRVVASAVGNVPIPTSIGNYFIPAAPGRYTFTYVLEIEIAALNNLNISAKGANPGDTYITIDPAPSHSIVVSGLNTDDINIVFQDDIYSNLVGADAVDYDNNTSEIKASNVLSQMTNSSARDITLSMTDLNAAMTLSYEGEPTVDSSGVVYWNERDKYEFGRIYLPNMFAEFENELSTLYNFNLSTASHVTVAHSANPDTNIFDSKLIGASDATTRERQFVDVEKSNEDLGRFYYFQPAGSVYVAKPTNPKKDYTTFVSTRGEPTGDEPKLYQEDGRWYHWDATYNSGAGAWYWFDFYADGYGYKDPDYIEATETKYGAGDRSSLEDRNTIPDGTYVVTYTITYGDATSTVTFKISVGDTAVPTIEFDETTKIEGVAIEEYLFGDSRKIGDVFEIKTNYFHVRPNGSRLTELEPVSLEDNDPNQATHDYFARWYVASNMLVSVTRPGGQYDLPVATSSTATDSTSHLHKSPIDNDGTYGGISSRWLKGSNTADPELDEWGYVKDLNGDRIIDPAYDAYKGNRTWSFTLSESGDYRITFQIQSETGQTAFLTRVITVDEPTTKSTIAPEVIWGTILIIISGGLLIGVVVYFIQTGRKTKFSQNKLKGKKVKEDESAPVQDPDGVV